jgi:type I restriction-modification system DNA methylase subunit
MLHEKFVIKNLNDRMIFTGVVLVASKYSNGCFEDYAGIEGFKQCVVNKLTSRFTNQELKSKKINDLTSSFHNIQIGTNPSDATIKQLCTMCEKINAIITQNPLSNIDIMNIFFTEFNRYRGKSEHGQVFTPDHVADLMSKLLDIKPDDNVLDPTCGSGSLLVKTANRNSKN